MNSLQSEKTSVQVSAVPKLTVSLSFKSKMGFKQEKDWGRIRHSFDSEGVNSVEFVLK